MVSALDNLEYWAIGQGYDPDTDYITQDLKNFPSPEIINNNAYDPKTHYSKNFAKVEFACNLTGLLPPDPTMPPAALFEALEDIRSHFGDRIITINSGYRSPEWNKKVDGAYNSRHLTGDACDFTVRDVDPYDVYRYAHELIGNRGGVGRYDSFTHIDLRGHRARW